VIDGGVTATNGVEMRCGCDVRGKRDMWGIFHTAKLDLFYCTTYRLCNCLSVYVFVFVGEILLDDMCVWNTRTDPVSTQMI
jgi:hypothetical protein